MDLTTFQLKFIDFAIDEILPNIPATTINLFGMPVPLSASLMKFGTGVGLAMTTFTLEKYAPQLKAFGILSENNLVSVEKLSTAMTAEIQKIGKFSIGDFEFDEADVAKFITYLNR